MARSFQPRKHSQSKIATKAISVADQQQPDQHGYGAVSKAGSVSGFEITNHPTGM